MMKQSNMLRKTLMASAVVSGMVFAGAAQAQQVITFDPGDAIIGSSSGAFGVFPFFDEADASVGGANSGRAANGAVVMDRLEFIAFNTGLNQAGAAPGDAQRGSWNLNFAEDGTFTEDFTFVATVSGVNSQIDTNWGDSAVIPTAAAGDPTASFISIVARLSGRLAGGADVTALRAAIASGNSTNIANQLDLEYDDFANSQPGRGTFEFFFHEDFNAAGEEASIGVFNVENGSSQVGESDAKIELNWFTVASEQHAPEFLDANGNPFDPFETLTKDYTQGVEVFEGGSQDFGVGNGVSVGIFSRGGESGFATFPNNVPEPGVVGLFGIGLLGLGFAAHRRRKQSAMA